MEMGVAVDQPGQDDRPTEIADDRVRSDQRLDGGVTTDRENAIAAERDRRPGGRTPDRDVDRAVPEDEPRRPSDALGHP